MSMTIINQAKSETLARIAVVAKVPLAGFGGDTQGQPVCFAFQREAKRGRGEEPVTAVIVFIPPGTDSHVVGWDRQARFGVADITQGIVPTTISRIPDRP